MSITTLVSEDHLRNVLVPAVERGARHIYLQSTSPNKRAFIELCAKEIIPYVRDTHGH